jgi:hypothetical protein
MGKVFVGHDWAEAQQTLHVEDESGRRLATFRLPEGVEGVRRFHELVAAHADEPSPPSPPAPAPERSTTNDEPPATPTTAPYAPSPTASSASSTAASDTRPFTTNTPPGHTEPSSPLDEIDPWDV